MVSFGEEMGKETSNGNEKVGKSEIYEHFELYSTRRGRFSVEIKDPHAAEKRESIESEACKRENLMLSLEEHL